jgi:mersacidin/lichenicidin family type 2 lantibiotic
MAGIKINNLDIDIIRAWKDEEYRNSLSEEQRSQLPENPAGMIELSDEDMGSVVGGFSQLCCGGGLSAWMTNPVSEVSEAGFVS